MHTKGTQMAKEWDPGHWPADDGRPRVLIEEADGAVRWAGTRALTAAGYDVADCAGPQGMGRKQCPAVTTGSCALAEEADAIYTSLPWGDPGSRDVLLALRSAYPDTPIVVEASLPHVAEHPELQSADAIVTMPVDAAAMRRALADVLPPRAVEDHARAAD
jgi:hypothetical protein